MATSLDARPSILNSRTSEITSNIRRCSGFIQMGAEMAVLPAHVESLKGAYVATARNYSLTRFRGQISCKSTNTATDAEERHLLGPVSFQKR